MDVSLTFLGRTLVHSVICCPQSRGSQPSTPPVQSVRKPSASHSPFCPCSLINVAIKTSSNVVQARHEVSRTFSLQYHARCT
ncbi:MAG: hypothetical protein BJ554DRAFT_7326 [Olpidium bornovanus]|uniref:Uncharacterized protein n=1 Tax=Olpidium bornovanus TaxID=278681 RepID=A0A8H7ZW10_9FUNG|nr:MAG: hypothetical protein BJ554DRAFT_7326 [Olpidium bornovanus]